jgi:hypothetical protein
MAAIDRFLNDELTSFAFNEAIFEIESQTFDETVKHVVYELWHYYSDCDDHRVRLDRTCWNYIQRLRLLLKSDAGLEVSKRRVWTPTQAISALAVAVFAWTVYASGVGEHLVLITIPLGVLSIALSKWRERLMEVYSTSNVALVPFTSIAQLYRVRRSVTSFRKDRYPPYLASRTVEPSGFDRAHNLHGYFTWLIFSPAVLLVQLLPVSVTRGRVKTPLS